MFTVHLFGPLTIKKDGTALVIASQPGRDLLAYLLYHSTVEHARAQLCDVFWPDLDEAAARRRLSSALWTVTQAVGDRLITRNQDHLGIDYAQVEGVDVRTFEDALDHAAQQANDREALSYLQQAMICYRAPLLVDDYRDWVIAEQERLRERYLQALQRLIAAYKAVHDFEQAVQCALTLIQADPLREDAYQEAIRLYHVLGRPHEAQRIFAQLTSTLRTEVDAEPTAQTTSLLARASALSLPEAQTSPFEQDLPLVGRSYERRTLLEHLERAAQGQGGVLFISSEPGVGKSRLLDALAEDASWRGALVLRGYAQDATRDEPYGPLIDALQAGLSPLRAQQAATLLDKLWLSVAAILLPDLAAWLPGIAPLPPMKTDQERIRLMEGLVRLILALGEVNPLLLILEDLHWADEATLDVLAYLSQRLAASRVLLAASFRPADARNRAAVWAGLEAVDRAGVLARLSLSPLSVDETAELVQRTLRLKQPAMLFATRIHDKTGGNPLFVLETLHTLYAEGLLVRDASGAWTTPFDTDTVDYAELPLLPAVEGTILRRLARLDDIARRLLDAASVAGTEISLPMLSDIAEVSGLDLLLALGALVQQGLLYETATAYRFSHDVVRETVYVALAGDERRMLHRRTADFMAGEHSAHAAELAYHRERAGLRRLAVQSYSEAGEHAATVHAYRQSLAHFDRAEALLAEDGVSLPVRLLFAREQVLDVLGERERQRADLDQLAHRMANLAPDMMAGNLAEQIKLELRYGQMLATLGDYPASQARLHRALALARAKDDTEAEARILAALGEILYWSGDNLAALPVLEQAIALSRKVAALTIEAEAESSLSASLSNLARYVEALAAAERATARYRTLGDRVGEADVQSAIGAILSEQGDVAGAERGYAEALAIHREVGYRYGEARTLINWGVVTYMQGQAGRALELFEQASQIAQQIDSQRAWSFAETSIAAVISTYVGNLPHGRKAIDAVIELQRDQGNQPLLAQALSILAQFDYLAGDLNAALMHLDEGLAALDDSAEMPFLLAQIHQARALANRRLGNHTEAMAEIEIALAFHASFDFADLVSSFLATKAQILRQQDRFDEAAVVIHAAVEALTDGVPQSYLVHFEHFCILQAQGQMTDALAALTKAHRSLTQMLETLGQEHQAISRTQIPAHVAILAAWAAQQATHSTVTLPRAGAALGRPLRKDEQISITWTVETPDDRAIASKSKRRRHQIVRLLHEAQMQGAVPAYRHLAEALGVSERTVLRDMAALEGEVQDLPPTRGAA